MPKHCTDCEYAKATVVEKSADLVLGANTKNVNVTLIKLKHRVQWKCKKPTKFCLDHRK